jgi:excisionase family DNA binding protein
MPVMTIAEAALALGVSTDTVRRRVKRGELRETQDARGHLCVDLDGTEPALEVVGRSAAPQLATEVSHLRAMLEHATQERDRAIEESQAWRTEAQRASGERAELLRALQQQQALQAASVGLKLIAEDGGSVTAQPAQGPKRHWWQGG